MTGITTDPGSAQWLAQIAIRRQLHALVAASMRQRSESEALVTADNTWCATTTPLNGKPHLALLRQPPAEAEMTARLASGERLEAIAVARGVCVDTVRTQLRAVFRKTGTPRQGELVCVVG